MLGPDRQWHWIVYDLEKNQSTATPLLVPGEYLPKELLLYGNMTRDNDGAGALGLGQLRMIQQEKTRP